SSMRDGLRARSSAIAGRRGRSGSESVERGRPSSRAIVATPPRRFAVCHPEVPVGAPIPDVRVKDATIPVEGGAMPGVLALPERVGAPGILIVNDVFGRSPFYDNLARRLAQAGFVAMTPEYFFREGSLPEPTREAAVARAKRLDFKRWGRDMSAAIDWLRVRPEVNRAIGTIGFCMGGTPVLLLSGRRGGRAATGSHYGVPAEPRTGASPVGQAPSMTRPT